MTDNVRVALRVRPLNVRELTETGDCKCLDVNSGSSTIVLDTKPAPKSYTYDYVADSDISQEEIFQTLGQPVATYSLSGYNATLFAYGQTGAGKTYTVIGPNTDLQFKSIHKGLLPRCIEYIFSTIYNETVSHQHIEYSVTCSFLEIYQEQIIDLLDTKPNPPHLNLREDTKSGVYVENLTICTVQSSGQTIDCLKRGLNKRHIASTSMNKESSRAHSVFTIYIQCNEKKEDVLNIRNSRFHVIDLAGSERQKSTLATGDRLKEAGNINKSLSALGNVINSLVEISEGKSRHVHYRDSKLTFLLKDSLGGNSKTTIIALVSPAPISLGETLSTLKFAQRAKLVRNKARINENTTEIIQVLKNQIKKLEEELHNSGKEKSCSNSCGSSRNISPDLNLYLYDKVKDLERLLAENLILRERTEITLQNEIETRDNHIYALLQNIQTFEKKAAQDMMVIKLRDATIQRLQYSPGVALPDEYLSIIQENSYLREQVEHHPMASKLLTENDRLKHYIAKLQSEIKTSPESMAKRLKDNQELTARLVNSLQNCAKERESTKEIIQEYQKMKSGERMESPYQKQAEDLIEELKYYKGIVEELNQVRQESEVKTNSLSQNGKEELEEKIRNLSYELQSCRENLESLENANSFLVKEIHSLKMTHDDILQQNQQHLNHISNLQAQIHQLQYSETQNLQLQSQLNEAHSKISALQEEKNRRNTKDLKISRRSSAHITKENLPPSEQDLQIDDLTHECSQLSKQVDSLKSNVDYYMTLTSKAKQEISDLNSEISHLRSHSQFELQAKDLKINELSEETFKFKQEIGHYVQNVNDLESQLQDLDSELLILQDYKDKYDEISSEREVLEGEIKQLKDELDTKEVAINYYCDQLKSFSSKQEDLQNRVISLESKLEYAAKDSEKYKNDYEIYYKKYSNLSGHINHNQKIQIHEKLKKDLNVEKQRNEDLTKRLERALEELERYRNMYR